MAVTTSITSVCVISLSSYNQDMETACGHWGEKRILALCVVG